MSDGYTDAKAVESRTVAILFPYLKERAHDGQIVLCNKGPLAKFLQETTGDVLFNADPDRVFSVEIKGEEKHTGNFFLETWSNRNLEVRASHNERGSNRGWLDKLRADLLLWYFLNTDDLYVFNLFRLQRWSFGHGDTPGRIYQFPEVMQRKNRQLNDTWGRLVDIGVIEREVGFRHTKVRQLALFENESSPTGVSMPPRSTPQAQEQAHG